MGLCGYINQITLIDCDACIRGIIGNGQVGGAIGWVRHALNKGKLCERPITIHPVKNPSQYLKVYRLLTNTIDNN